MIAFKDFRIYPSEILFCNYGDGLKNYFTLLSYVKSPDHNLFRYNTFNYPFGEFVFTTDDTPLFSIPFKWFCQHIYDVSDYTIPVYNTFMILNILVCGLLTFAVLRRLLKQDLIALIMSIILSWTNMQVMRIWRGHFNLSLSSFIVAAILLTLIWQQRSTERKKQFWTAAGIVAINYFGFLAHGYYIAILGIFQSAALFFFGIYTFKSREGKFSIIASVILPVISLVLVFATIKFVDGFYHLRSSQAGGYDWMETKIRFWGLFAHYDFHTIFFPIKAQKGSWDPENMGYLGNVGLYALLALFITVIASKSFRIKTVDSLQAFFRSITLGPLFFSCLLMLIISWGELYYTSDDGIIIYNFLNPLYLVHKFSDVVTQFRALGRFAWPFFWGFNICMLYLIVSLFPTLHRRSRSLVILAIVVLGGAEVKDYADALQARASKKNVFQQGAYNDLKKLKIDFSRYQAMLALPYYNVGAEAGEFVLDDYEETSTFSYQMALYTGLPLMNVKLSRTVLQQARALDSLVAYDVLTEELKKRFTDKPVLVFLDKKNAEEKNLNNRPVAADIQTKAIELPMRHQLKPIDSSGNFIFYEWYPKSSI